MDTLDTVWVRRTHGDQAIQSLCHPRGIQWSPHQEKAKKCLWHGTTDNNRRIYE